MRSDVDVVDSLETRFLEVATRAELEELAAENGYTVHDCKINEFARWAFGSAITNEPNPPYFYTKESFRSVAYTGVDYMRYKATSPFFLVVTPDVTAPEDVIKTGNKQLSALNEDTALGFVKTRMGAEEEKTAVLVSGPIGKYKYFVSEVLR